MADRVKALSTIKPDFYNILAQLEDYLSTRPVWKDRLRSSAGQFTLEVASAIGELDQYSLERIMQDAFPETAKLDSAVYAAMKSLGTRLRRKIPGVTTLPLYTIAQPGGPNIGETRLRRTTNTGSEIIPPYTQFSTPLGLMFNRVSIKFAAGSNFAYQVGYNSLGNEVPQPISLYEGRVEKRYFSMTGEDFASIFSAENNFVISNEDVRVDLGTGGSYVGTIPRQTVGLWNNKNNIPGWQDITTADGGLHILFGSSMYGTVPAANQLCIMTYAVTKGSGGNGVFPTYKLSCADFPNVDSSFDTLVAVEGDSSASLISGGTDEVNADTYRKLGSQLYSADQGNKAVIPQDYAAVVKDYAGISDALVLGQSLLDPTDLRFMNVAKIVTYPKNLSSAAFQELKTYVEKRSMMSMNFYREENSVDGTAVEPIIREVNLRANVYCFQNSDLIGTRDNFCVPAVYSIIDKEWTPTNNASTGSSKLNRRITLSDFTTAIKNSHPSVDYVQLIVPTLDVIAKPYIEAVNASLTGVPNVFSTGASYFYVVTMDNYYGQTLPSAPLSATVVPGGDSPVITVNVPPNFVDAVGQPVWGRLQLYRGTSLENMQLLVTDWADWSADNVSLTSWSYLDTGADFIQPGIFPPVQDTTKEWVINLPSNWSATDQILMFNSERSPQLPAN